LASSIGNIGKVPELRRRLLFTVVCLAVYRIGVFVTTPGVNRVEMKNVLSSGGSGSFLGMFNMFSGGALEKMSLFALGIMPYVSASIILQLLTVVVPTLDRLNKEGEQGRKKINQYTRYGCVILSMIQSFFIATWLESLGRGGFSGAGSEVVANPGWAFRLLTMISLTTGTAFIMWLGEQITERGIGNGISLIIFAGIVTGLPDALARLWSVQEMGDVSAFDVLMIAALVVGVVAAITFFERAIRKVPVQYAKRLVGRKMYGGQSSYLPLKINTSGVIPPIFASSILLFPAQIANMANSTFLQQAAQALTPGDWRYDVLYVVLIIFFCYFYTAVTFNPVDVADNMKKHGGFIPGIRPGKKTAEYIDRVLTRITFAGAIYISVICILPSLLKTKMKVPFYFGGTGLLIVVGVALDTVQQIESHLITRNYEGFGGPKGPRIRGRTARTSVAR
jgi:preprotein translocase subunit SecY